ncbi:MULTISPECIES: response regulator transcription factor [Acinetobacter]|jgi:Response regulator containing a CheY-like receiver domain and an HTH DNA-binding domain|uniref:DNA-binding response regulator n=1 Tax=Acinetobacter amyesii TaxID=2942470 RepID=A0A1T1H6H5_9GAMM|nr:MULTISPECIES: response regulator transcription factor [Acinetobacter]MCL6238390.1 response regulator transcription factor [Acinetobacter amyesii]MCL6240100.1 response regulator transcription factor [Acinetobacter amyesii]MCL6243504.1 response regulator transcription factor [Acinetobacter amyesii]MCL6248312.1 response regulator transcription factor [Acinetobacter amyesii]OOV81527.1 DNA-binding response regulator [Acinetobacter sp. ANC 5600]
MSPQEVILPVPVLVVEDEEIIQLRLRQILTELGYKREELIFTKNVKESIQAVETQPISLALVDLGLPDGSGIEIIEKIRSLESNTMILVVSAWSTQESLFAAIKAGATGYVLKERDDAEVLLSIRSILRGGAPIDPFIAREILKQISEAEAPSPEQTVADEADLNLLTSREKEILCLVAQGLSNREIAEQLFVSRYTVESHIKHIYRKLAVTKRTKAVSTARSMGIL